MQKRILFIDDTDTTEGFPPYAQAFVEKGFTVLFCKPCTLFPIDVLFLRIETRLGLRRINTIRRMKRKTGMRVCSILNDYKPDIVFSINAKLDSYYASIIRKKCFLVSMLIDKVSFFPDVFENGFSKDYDVIYTYAIDDCEMINSISSNCVFIPAVCNKDSFHNDNVLRDIDVSFVGRMYPEKDYGERFDLLCRLVDSCPDLKIYIGGECAPIRRPIKFIKWRRNQLYRKAFVNRNLTTSECNQIYNRSKISLSIERNGTGNAWSGRIVNLFGTGTFVLSSDEPKMLDQYYKGCFVHFTGFEDLRNKVLYYLDHEKERIEIASRAYEQEKTMRNSSLVINMTEDIINRFYLMAGMN